MNLTNTTNIVINHKRTYKTLPQSTLIVSLILMSQFVLGLS
jgi:hypothetical protein